MDALPLNTFTVVVSGAAVIASTFVRHFIHRKTITKEVPARDNLLFDEAFSVVKNFFEKASLHTVEDLQAFGNNFMPSPFWVRVIRVTIPASVSLDAGRILIDTLGEEEVKNVLGGREWWQRTANRSGGVKGEWISMKKDWQGLDAGGAGEEGMDKLRAEKLKEMKKDAKEKEKRRWKMGKEQLAKWDQEGKEGKEGGGKDASEATSAAEPLPLEGEEESYSADMDEMRCMLYIHGGAYFFGSVNTHRYSIWRYARKTGGRAFAIDYRLAPQYPFPCALADALASYLYLIRPPPGAKHRPVDPAKLTLAGDSAGGGLCLALLCLIRDSGLPAPAGAVLLSPWCDLTHSFPSILQNTATDVIPPYGFLFKPSTLWPPPPAEFQDRANKQTSLPGLKAAHEKKEAAKEERKRQPLGSILRRTSRKASELAAATSANGAGNPTKTNPQATENTTTDLGHEEGKAEVAEIFKVKIDGEEVEVRDQIQLYATNEQLVYPFVSPVWQPSLGGLPPLYVMAGANEVLRDEIIYMAHRAANPVAYPLRQALLDANPERSCKAATYGPTKVHLQIYDDACHDLPLFSFTTPAKFCYRAIASFVKFVTAPESERASSTNTSSIKLPVETESRSTSTVVAERLETTNGSDAVENLAEPTSPSTVSPPPLTSSPTLAPAPTPSATPDCANSSTSASSISSGNLRPSFSRHFSKPKVPKEKTIPGIEKTIYSSTDPLNRPPYVDNMVRERVSITGVVRPLEPASELAALNLDPDDIGLVKEGPVKRYLAGKALWDARFSKTYEKVHRRREHHLTEAMREEAHRIRKHLKKAPKAAPPSQPQGVHPPRTESPEPMTPLEGIWELHGERPPPSSIAARKDTSEARKLAHALDERYSKLHALHLWSEVQEISTLSHRKDTDTEAVSER